MDQVIAFQSVSFPAEEFYSVDCSDEEWPGGLACLQTIFDGVCGGPISPFGEPGVENDGGCISCNASVRAMHSTVLLALHVLPRLPERPDIWVLQVKGYSGWLRALFMGRERANAGAEAVYAAALEFLLARPHEFSDVRSCKWNDLDSDP